MPTLIRLLVFLLVLAGIAYGAMYALVIMVKPNEKEVTIRIPARDLVPAPSRDPLVVREIDTTRTPESPPPAAAAAEPTAPVGTADGPVRDDAVTQMPPPQSAPSDVVTLQPGVE